MGAPCKLRFSKPGKGTTQTAMLLKRHSITVHGATAKRGSANTPTRWKPRRPHDVWRSNHAPLFGWHASPDDARRDTGTICATGQAERFSSEIRGKRQRAGGEGVRRTGWTGWFVGGLGATALGGGEKPSQCGAPH